MAKSFEYMKSADGDPGHLPSDRNGATLLARELLDADSVDFLVGQSISEFYQNPNLPKNISIRKNLIREYIEYLRELGKEVKVTFC